MHDVYQALKAYHQKMKHEREQVPFLSLCVVLVGVRRLCVKTRYV
jgi:hypothetical protein